MAEKEEKQVSGIKQSPLEDNIGSTPWTSLETSYLRAIWTGSKEAGGGILRHQESLPRVLPGEMTSQLHLALLTDAGCLKGKKARKW